MITIYTDNQNYSNEMITLLKVFYPFETIEQSDEEQSSYRVYTLPGQRKVAYFDGEKEVFLRLEAADDVQAEAMEGKAKRVYLKTKLKALLL